MAESETIKILAITVIIKCDNCGAEYSIQLPLGADLKTAPPMYYYTGMEAFREHVRLDEIIVICSVCKSPDIVEKKRFPFMELVFKDGNRQKSLYHLAVKGTVDDPTT